MENVEGVLLSLPSNTVNANMVKDSVIRRLWKDGAITEEQADEYSESWGVIIIKNGWFKTWVKKFTKDADTWEYRFIKLEIE